MQLGYCIGKRRNFGFLGGQVVCVFHNFFGEGDVRVGEVLYLCLVLCSGMRKNGEHLLDAHPGVWLCSRPGASFDGVICGPLVPQ